MKQGTVLEEIRIESHYNIGDLIKKGITYSWEDLFDMLDDLYSDYESLKEEYEDFKNEVEDNYKPISYEKQIGYNEKDFYDGGH